jgi:hypothetical protein
MRRFHGTEPAHSGYFLCAAKTAQSRQHCPAKLGGLPETPALVGTPLGPGALPGPFYAERASEKDHRESTSGTPMLETLPV